MKVVVGLGNPGPRYRHTRHNVGFMVLDAVSARLNAPIMREKGQALVAAAIWEGERVLLVKPQTFMNLSGVAVAQATRNQVEDCADLLIVVDDVNLPLGRLRLRAGGSAGGHNGLKSVIEHLGTPDFPRLRIGVGEGDTGGALTDHVLGRFRPDELPDVEKAVGRAADAVLCFVKQGIEKAMNEYNLTR